MTMENWRISWFKIALLDYGELENCNYLSFSYLAVGGGCPAELVDEKIVMEYRKAESQNMNETLKEYLSICRGNGVNLSNTLNKSSLHTHTDKVDVHSISQNNDTWKIKRISQNIS